MTQLIEGAGPHRQHGWLVLSLAVSAAVLGGVTFDAVQALSRDDCTTVTTMMPDGSQVATKTCS